MDFEFTDNSMKAVAEIERAIAAALHEAGGEFLSQAQRNTREDTGDTKASFDYKVVDDTVYVGSNAENAIWEEFGTGVHAENGGRQDKWRYEDRHGEWHTTDGKKGTRALTKAMQAKAPAARRIVESKLGGA